MGRMVHIDTGYVACTAVQDLLEIKLGTTQAGFVHSIKVYQRTEEDASPTNEVLQIDCKRATSTFTSGSGGGTATVVKANTADAAHGLATIEKNNTTQAVVNTGTLEVLANCSDVLNVNAGSLEITLTPELRPPIGPSEAFIVSLEEAPTDSVTLRAVVSLEITHG